VFAWKASGTAPIQIGPEIVVAICKATAPGAIRHRLFLYRAGPKLPRQLTHDRSGLLLSRTVVSVGETTVFFPEING